MREREVGCSSNYKSEEVEKQKNWRTFKQKKANGDENNKPEESKTKNILSPFRVIVYCYCYCFQKTSVV